MESTNKAVFKGNLKSLIYWHQWGVKSESVDEERLWSIEWFPCLASGKASSRQKFALHSPLGIKGQLSDPDLTGKRLLNQCIDVGSE